MTGGDPMTYPKQAGMSSRRPGRSAPSRSRARCAAIRSCCSAPPTAWPSRWTTGAPTAATRCRRARCAATRSTAVTTVCDSRRRALFVGARPGSHPVAGQCYAATGRRARSVGLGLDGRSAGPRVRPSPRHPVGDRRGMGSCPRHGAPRRPLRPPDRQPARSLARDVPPRRTDRNTRGGRDTDHDDGRRARRPSSTSAAAWRGSSVPSSIRDRRASARRSTGGRTSSTTRPGTTSSTSASRRLGRAPRRPR